MAYELKYATYNPGQYPAEHGQALQDMVNDGWRVLGQQLNYNEVYILWHRGDPAEADSPAQPSYPHPDGTDSDILVLGPGVLLCPDGTHIAYDGKVYAVAVDEPAGTPEETKPGSNAGDLLEE